ncbi:MAG: pentatricopeptide repeat-containing protein [Acidobacteriota bacterium]
MTHLELVRARELAGEEPTENLLGALAAFSHPGLDAELLVSTWQANCLAKLGRYDEAVAILDEVRSQGFEHRSVDETEALIRAATMKP